LCILHLTNCISLVTYFYKYKDVFKWYFSLLFEMRSLYVAQAGLLSSGDPLTSACGVTGTKVWANKVSSTL
jgi:hypothetical protein